VEGPGPSGAGAGSCCRSPPPAPRTRPGLAPAAPARIPNSGQILVNQAKLVKCWSNRLRSLVKHWSNGPRAPVTPCTISSCAGRGPRASTTVLPPARPGGNCLPNPNSINTAVLTYQCYQTLSASQLITTTDNSGPKEVPLSPLLLLYSRYRS